MGEQERSLIYEFLKPYKKNQFQPLEEAILKVDELLSLGEIPRAGGWGGGSKIVLFVSTDNRLILHKYDMYTKLVEIVDIPIRNIESVTHKLGLLTGKINIKYYSNRDESISNVNKQKVRLFVAWLSEHIGEQNIKGNGN